MEDNTTFLLFMAMIIGLFAFDDVNTTFLLFMAMIIGLCAFSEWIHSRGRK